MNRIKLPLFFCAFALLATACGQRGPLVLPEPEASPQTQPAPAAEPEKEDEENSGT